MLLAVFLFFTEAVGTLGWFDTFREMFSVDTNIFGVCLEVNCLALCWLFYWGTNPGVKLITLESGDISVLTPPGSEFETADRI